MVHPKAIQTILLSLLWLVAALLPGGVVRAQSDESAWVTAIPIPDALAAADPVVVAGPQGIVQVFWWDEAEGLTTAIYDGNQWSTPDVSRIGSSSEQPEDGARFEEMPTILEDGQGWAHALWLGAESNGTGFRPLLHSRLAIGTSNWSRSNQVTNSATAWHLTTSAGGTLYLIYSRPTDTANRPAGLYYQRSFDGGVNWTTPLALATAPDFQNARQEKSFLQIVASAKGNVYVSWDDPQTNRAMLTWSDDGGRSWREPRHVVTSDHNARRAQIIPGRENELLMLWEASRSGLATGLYQQRSLDGGQTWHGPEQVMASWAMSAQGIILLPLPDGRAWLLVGGQAGALGLSIWDGERAAESETAGWSEVQRIGLRAAETAGGPILVGVWRAILRDTTVTLVGRDTGKRIWAVRLSVQDMQGTYAPTPVEPQMVVTSEVVVPDWEEPINLSRSGSASQPSLVSGQEGACQVFWWDQFDGLMGAYYNGTSWGAATASPILIPRIVEKVPREPETLWEPLAQMPQIVGDAHGRAHAFWLMVPPSNPGESSEDKPALPALMHSTLSLGQATWSQPQAVAEAALAWQTFADPGGHLHLLYVRSTHTESAPAGVYYTSLTADGSAWSAPQVLYPSIYARLLSAEQVYLAGAADAEGHLVAAWNDPRLGRTFMAHSANGDASWERPTEVTTPDMVLPQLAAVGDSGFLVLWQGARAGYTSVLYEQRSTDGGRTWNAPRRVLDNLNAGTREMAFRHAEQGNVLLVAGEGSPNLTLATWDASQRTRSDMTGWSEPQGLEMSLSDPETGRAVWLEALQLGITQGQMILVGKGQDGEIWALQRVTGGLEWMFAPPPPWSEPVSLSSGQGYPGLLSIAADIEGQVHVLWSEAVESPLPSASGGTLAQGTRMGSTLAYARWDGARWSPPAQVLSSPDGRAEQPCLVAAGEHLHAVWSGGANGQIYYSRAFLRDGSTAGGWSEPLALPGPAAAQGLGSAPHLVADLGGNLHLVYAVPLNEGRGIYYLRSDDGGVSWSLLHTVFDAATAGWARVDQPAVGVDADGTLYVTWVRATLDGSMTEGIYFASSHDAGESWSDALPIADGPCTYPQIAVARQGNVHLLWHDAAGNGAWTGRWSVDEGRNWAPPIRVRGFTEVRGRPALVSDLAGGLHLLGIGPDEVGEPVLRYTTWSSESYQWETLEQFGLGKTLAGDSGSADVVAVLLASRGQLHAALRGIAADGAIMGGESVEQVRLFYTQRAIPEVEQMPVLMVTPAPTPSPTPALEGTPAPSPTPTINPAPPLGAQAVGLGPLTLPLLGVGGILAVVMLLGGILLLRSLWKQGGRDHRRPS